MTSRLRTQYALSASEAALVLGDILSNLEALVHDLTPREDIGTDAGRSPERILSALEAVAAHLECPELAELAAAARASYTAAGAPLPDSVVEPLQRLVAGLRRASPEAACAIGS